MDAVSLDDAALSALPVEVLRDEVSRRYKQFSKTTVTTQDGRKVRFIGVGLRETRTHSADRKTMDLLAKAHDILPNAAPLWSEAHQQKRPSDSIRAWHYYGAEVAFGGEEYLARLVVREDVNGNIYYDNVT
jgi:hypothetical protein